MSIDAMKLALEVLEEMNKLSIGEHAICLPAEIDPAIEALRQALEQPNARTLHKMMLAMIKAHWHSIDPQWKDDPELCHALGYEAGYDAVARRVEPPAAESGAGFESLPASPHTMTEST